MRPFLIAIVAVGIMLAETPTHRRIAITRVNPQPGQLALFVAAADGGDEHALLDTKDTDYDPVWAPDNKSIVFTSERNGSAELYRVKPDGTGFTQLTKDPAYDDQAAFSPDSKQLVFVSTRGGAANLWTMDLSTLRAKQLTSGRDGDFRPSWAPDGKWIAFSSGRDNPMPFAHGRWERLQLADIYIMRPDGSGLRKLTTGGNFCGSPKWTSDSSRIITYCMAAEMTLANRMPSPAPGSDTRLVSIEIGGGGSTDVAAGPGVKMNPSPLAGDDIGYIRKDTTEAGIYYTSGRRGPRGPIRAASWSPDASQVVFTRRADIPRRNTGATPAFSRNSRYELSLSGLLPSFSSSGKDFGTASAPSANPRGASLNVTNVETGQGRVVYRDQNRNILPGGWLPSGDRIIFAIGRATRWPPLRLSATPAVSPSGCLAPAGRGSAARNKSAVALTSISECRSGGA